MKRALLSLFLMLILISNAGAASLQHLYSNRLKIISYMKELRIKLKTAKKSARIKEIKELLRGSIARLELLEGVIRSEKERQRLEEEIRKKQAATQEAVVSRRPSSIISLRTGMGGGIWDFGLHYGIALRDNFFIGPEICSGVWYEINFFSYGLMANLKLPRNLFLKFGINNVKYSTKVFDIPGLGGRVIEANPTLSGQITLGRSLTFRNLPTFFQIGYDYALGVLVEGGIRLFR